MKTVCVVCKREYVYSRRKGHRKTKCTSCWSKIKRDKRKALFVAYKGGKCEHCGYSKSVRALGFHHTDPKKKSFGISKCSTNSIKRVKRELDKCLLLCANCHMEEEERISTLPMSSKG